MPKERRLNIALMVGAFENYFTRQLCKGAMAAAAETDSNLVIFPGRQYNPPFTIRPSITMIISSMQYLNMPRGLNSMLFSLR